MSAPSKLHLARRATREINRAKIVDENFVEFVASWSGEGLERSSLDQPVRADRRILGSEFLELLECQLISRHLDLAAREMRMRNESFYTIGSSGHECNAALGLLTRVTDPAFLHYRSGAFMAARARKQGDVDPIYSTTLALAASSEDPIAGGRHKVWGHKALWVLPQTSTIASHLPKAVGTALALEEASRLHLGPPVPGDSVIVCSFGDASVNHSAALGAFNAAEWAAYQYLPVPILFVCEDNRFGISVRSPSGWIERSFSQRPCMSYLSADGCDLVESYEAAAVALEVCRQKRRPVFLHLKLERLLGHAGTDVETEYRQAEEIASSEAHDPLLVNARTALELGLISAQDLLERYQSIRKSVHIAAGEAAKTPKLRSAAEVMLPLAPLSPTAVHVEATRAPATTARVRAFGDEGRLPENAAPGHLALLLNRGLVDLMAKYPEMLLFGEDVAQKGGVYTVTSGLAATFKGGRIFNTLLDETTILGLAQGAANMGLLPFPEIQYLAYFHNACDQIRGEACSLQFFSRDQFRNPMVVRIAALGYQKGFGGHFHNDNSTTALRDIPGLIVACPSRGDDAVTMLRTCAALAKIDGRVVAFLEPIALYMTKDLYEPKDGQWRFEYPAIDKAAPFGEGRVYRLAATDLLIVTYGNGVPMSLRAARRLREASGHEARVLDLRWLKPLNTELIARHADEVGKVLVVDEGRRTGGISEEIFTALDEKARPDVIKQRVVGEDTYIPLGPAANLVLPSEDDVYEAARELAT